MAIDHKFSNTSADSILELLQSNLHLKVPRFQRNYSWNTDRVETLWLDMMDNFNLVKNSPDASQEAQYLLGPIVLVNNPQKKGSYFVIDGQQRLSTLTMLFCVARDIILEDTHTEDVQRPPGFEKIPDLIENRHMGKRTGWKLELNDTDKDFFREIQEYEELGKSQYDRIKKMRPEKPSLKFLKNNYLFLHEKMTNALHTNFGDDDNPDLKNKDVNDLRRLRISNHSMLLYFLTYVMCNNFIIKIMVSDDSSAFQIFETLNERGQPLSKSNLIKNHILNRVNDDEKQRDLSDRWNNIFDEIVSNNQRDDDFIMESYHSRNSDDGSLRRKYSPKNGLQMSKKNLYKIVRDMVSDEDDCEKFIAELNRDAEFLSMLNDPSNYFDEQSKEDVLAIKALKAKFIRVPLLAAYRKWYGGKNTDDYARLVKFLVKFFFKTRVVRQVHPGDIEKITAEATEMINNGGTAGDIITKLKEKDDHDDFVHDFKRFMAKPGKDAAKYTLQQITMYLGTPDDDVRPIDNLTLEYILPQKSDRWSEGDFFEGSSETGEKMADYVPRLGNLTLLKDAINTTVKNGSFGEKKEAGYGRSQLKINTETVRPEYRWTANTIKKRERGFADYADKIWNLDAF